MPARYLERELQLSETTVIVDRIVILVQHEVAVGVDGLVREHCHGRAVDELGRNSRRVKSGRVTEMATKRGGLGIRAAASNFGACPSKDSGGAIGRAVVQSSGACPSEDSGSAIGRAVVQSSGACPLEDSGSAIGRA